MDVDQLARATCLTLCSNNRIYVSMKISVDVMEAAADRASDLLKALANRHRLLIICQLIDGERSVGDLAEFLGLRDSTVSQHLALCGRMAWLLPDATLKRSTTRSRAIPRAKF